jgi:hypothetical protein
VNEFASSLGMLGQEDTGLEMEQTHDQVRISQEFSNLNLAIVLGRAEQ